MKQLLLFLFCILMMICVKGQKEGQSQIDSLMKVLATSTEDSNMVKTLNKLSGFAGWKVGNYDTAIYYARAAKTLSEKINYKKGIASAYGNMGITFKQLGNYFEAHRNQRISLKIMEEINDKRGIAACYSNIAGIYLIQGKYPEALNYYFAALKNMEEIRDKIGIAYVYTGIGSIHNIQCNYTEALKNYFISLKIEEEIGDKRGIASSYLNIGNVYKKLNNLPKALKHCLASMQIYEAFGDKQGMAICYTNIGSIYTSNDKAVEGKRWQRKALELSLKIGAKEIIKECYFQLAVADSTLNNFKGAYNNHILFIQYLDSLNDEEVNRKMLQAEMQFKFDKKEAEIKTLTDAELIKQKLIRNGFVGGFAVVVFFAGVFFRQRNKSKREKQRSDELLLNILPGEVADEIKTSGAVKTKAFAMVTVMFTDFKDFTSVSEMISAELLVEEINTCFSAFDGILQKYKIEKIKTIGDAYLCASGLPVSNYNHAEDMLNAAFEIRNFMLERKKEKDAKGEIPFELRIGIHSGPVVAGVVGINKYAYDIWGETVNIAARMEQNSEVGKINISKTTYELVKENFNCIYQGKIETRNKSEIEMFYVE